MRKTQKGAITIFVILTIILVASCLLVLLEGARGFHLRRLAEYKTVSAIESAFSNYSFCLWENYHLLGCDLEQAQSIVEECADGGYAKNAIGINLLLLRARDVQLEDYTLLTDGEGTEYIKAVASYMKENILYETAKTIYDQYLSIKEILDNPFTSGSEIDDALKCLEEAGKKARGGKSENPLETIKRLQKTQLLELVVLDTTKLSDKESDLSTMVSHRELSQGTQNTVREIEWSDRVLMQQYFLTYFADYTNLKESRGFSYELEYLVGGKGSDIENLREVVNQLLLIREAVNLSYLFSDVEKLGIAQKVALTLVGFTANGWIIEGVKLGLIAAWAFGESVLDVRALLQGKKIPIIKNQATWTLEIEKLGEIVNSDFVAKESDMGVSYKTYLGILLLLQKDKELAQRGMDLQELTMQNTSGGLKMDQLMVRGKVKILYQYAKVFPTLSSNLKEELWETQIVSEKEYGYY